MILTVGNCVCRPSAVFCPVIHSVAVVVVVVVIVAVGRL